MKYIKYFETDDRRIVYELGNDYIEPYVSYTEETYLVGYNTFLIKLTLADGRTVKIDGEGALTSEITAPYSATCVSAKIGAKCNRIGVNTFYNFSGLTSIDIPDSVTSIGESAFGYCRSLTSLTIPDSVANIGKNVFQGCGGSIYYNAKCPINANMGFNSNNAITTVVIGDATPSIGTSAFTSCSGLINVTIGSGATSVGNHSFRNCSKLASITARRTTAPTIGANTFQAVKTGGTLTVPIGSTGYNTWMQNKNYYLGKYNWTKVEQ